MRPLIITILALKGGDGKTFLGTTFARLLAGIHYNKRVLAIDLDMQGNLTEYLNGWQEVPEELSLKAVLSGTCSIEEALIHPAENIDLLPVTIEFAQMAAQLRPDAVKELIRKIGKTSEYDCILIDTPGTWNATVIAALNASDRVIVPLNTKDTGSIRTLMSEKRLITMVNPELINKLLVVPNRMRPGKVYEDRLSYAKQVLYDLSFSQSAIPESTKLHWEKESQIAIRDIKSLDTVRGIIESIIDEILAFSLPAA